MLGREWARGHGALIAQQAKPGRFLRRNSFHILNFRDQGGQFLGSADSCIAPQGKPSLGAALWQFHALDNPMLGRDSHSRRLPAELDGVLLFILTQVSPWSPGGVAAAYRSQPGTRKEEPWELRQRILPLLSQARNGVCDGMLCAP